MPGITQSVGPTGSSFGFDSQFGGFPDPTHIVGSGISANGSQSGANAWYLDGTLNATLGPESVVVNPSPDAVSEFNLVNNGLAAQWSRTSGAVVNIVLKSGTNAFHGDVYEYSRNSFFSASNPFSRRDPDGNFLSSPRVNYNDFGGTLGGPIIKNRLRATSFPRTGRILSLCSTSTAFQTQTLSILCNKAGADAACFATIFSARWAVRSQRTICPSKWTIA
jgi:hypothetical protein